VFHTADDIHVGEGRLDHDDVGPFVQIEGDFTQGLVAVGGVHLVAAPVAKLRRRLGGVAEGTVEAGSVLGRVAHDWQPGKPGTVEALTNGADHAVHHAARGHQV